HAAARQRQRARGRRPFVPHGADRGALDPRQFAPGPRVRRRPRALRPTLLHQLGRAAVHSGRAVERRGVFTVLASFSEKPLTITARPTAWPRAPRDRATRTAGSCVVSPRSGTTPAADSTCP